MDAKMKVGAMVKILSTDVDGEIDVAGHIGQVTGEFQRAGSEDSSVKAMTVKIEDMGGAERAIPVDDLEIYVDRPGNG